MANSAHIAGGLQMVAKEPLDLLAPYGACVMRSRVPNLAHCCIFLDFDGTIVPIEDRPENVRVNASTLRFIERLAGKAQGALALISGRDIAVIDRLLHPLILPVAGVHGLQRRDAAGRLHTPAIDQCIVESVAKEIESAFIGELGVAIERKAGAVALHYRLRPDYERRCHDIVTSLVRNRSELHLIEGNMVCEIRLDGDDKGAVIKKFLAERPFEGRIPIFAGDDATDESGFAAVNASGGASIKVGDGPSAARFRVGGVAELRGWFEGMMPARRASSLQ
jgi:trehalose 6-phosphate phosphatase